MSRVTPLLLQNLVFCVSVNNNVNEKQPEGEDSQLSYNALRAMITALGGRLSPTVHKNVSFLVASETAVANATQRVRKAVKFGVPVIRKEYIELCHSGLESGQPVDTDTARFLLGDAAAAAAQRHRPPPSAPGAGEAPAGSKRKRGIAASYMDGLGGPVVCGCACICHDRGEDACSYCEAAHSPAAAATEWDKRRGKKSKKHKKRKH